MSLKGFIKGTKRVNWHVLCFVFTFLLALQRHTPSFIYDWVLNTSLYFFLFQYLYSRLCLWGGLRPSATAHSNYCTVACTKPQVSYDIFYKREEPVQGSRSDIQNRRRYPVFLLKRFSQDFVQTFLKDFLRLHRNNPLNLGNHWDNYSFSGAKKC